MTRLLQSRSIQAAIRYNLKSKTRHSTKSNHNNIKNILVSSSSLLCQNDEILKLRRSYNSESSREPDMLSNNHGPLWNYKNGEHIIAATATIDDTTNYNDTSSSLVLLDLFGWQVKVPKG